MNQKDVLTIKKRIERYWFEDGLWEIGFGLVNILLAGFYLLVERLEPAGLVLMLVQMLVILGAFLGMGRLVKLLKERITYPRTGFVAYRKPAQHNRIRRFLLTGMLALVMAALVAASARVDILRNTTALVTGLLLAAALVFLGYRFGLTRMYVLAGLTVLLGFLLALPALPDSLAAAAFFGAFGLLIALSGTLALLVYLAHTQSDDGSNGELEA